MVELQEVWRGQNENRPRHNLEILQSLLYKGLIAENGYMSKNGIEIDRVSLSQDEIPVARI